jgi:choice-of-anchor B domain-containing protein
MNDEQSLLPVRFRGEIALWVLAAVFGTSAVCVAAVGGDQESPDMQRLQHREEFLADMQAPDPEPQWLAATPCVGGMAGVYPCHKIDLLTFMPLNQIGGGNGNDVWGWTDEQTGREFALMGRSNGTSFVEITDPENPVYVGNLPPHTANSTWRDIKTYLNHAYIVSEASGHGMQVFNLNQLLTATPGSTFTETAHYDNFGYAHNLAINEQAGFAYAVGTGTCSGGPHFVDLQSPASPVFAGCHIEAIYTHDTQCVSYIGPDPDHQNRDICINSNQNKINIIDVTNHAGSFLISTTTYSGASYTHQGWLTEDQAYWLQGDELDEQNNGHNTRTRIFDVRDLDDPVLIGIYDGPHAAIDHNLYTLDGYAYEANYRAGLQILDTADVANGNLTEYAYFDIYPSSNAAQFSGAWSVYPYFASGTVVVSGIEQGLFILRPQLEPDFEIETAETVLAVCDPGDAVTTVTLSGRNGYTGNVTLSALGLPAGASAGFNVNPVAVPGTSEMTISAAGVASGSYAFTLSGTDGTLTHEVALQLNVSATVAVTPTLIAPADGELDVSRVPTLQWAAAAVTLAYNVEVASDPGFAAVVFSASVPGTSVTLDLTLDAGATYYWRLRAINGCGAGPYSQVFSFTTLITPRVLLVDDDDNDPDVRNWYSGALDWLGEDYDVWDTDNTDDEPSATTLAPYEVVIWYTGDEYGGTAGPGAGGEQALEAWLDSSRCLLIGSQDYFFDRGLTGLIQNYLGVSAVDNDVAQTSVTGVGPIFSGLGPYTLAFPYTNFTDALTPDATAAAAFSGTTGTAGVSKDSGLYRTTYWGFGLETLPTDGDRQTILAAFLSWCETLAAADGDSDGTANGEDCEPGDATVWSAPSPARELVVGLTGLGWQPPANPGGNATLYDVLRSDDPADFGLATCIEPGESDTVATDAATPVSNGLYSYLVRAHNDCGSTLGLDSQLVARTGAACP